MRSPSTSSPTGYAHGAPRQIARPPLRVPRRATAPGHSTITAVSPPEYARQTVDVAIVGIGGTSLAIPNDQFNYDTPPTPPPRITGISPANAPTTGLNTVTITGSGLTGLTSLQVGPTLLTAGSGAFTVVNNNTATYTAAPEAGGTVD